MISQEELYSKYADILACYFETGDGWNDLLDELLGKLALLGGVKVTQIKVKFQMLRVYFDAKSETIYQKAADIIHEAEVRSTRVCSGCGDPGHLIGTNYWSNEASCSKCRSIYGKEEDY